MRRGHVRDVAGVNRVRRHITDLLSYLERDQGALVHYTARRRHCSPILTACAENTVSDIIAERMNKVRKMRWSRARMWAFLNMRTTAPNGTLQDASHCYSSFLLARDDHKATAAVS